MQQSQIKQSRRKAGEILERPPFECIALLLQGGALGAYQAGVYEALADKMAVVAGAASGIGTAIANAFALAGADGSVPDCQSWLGGRQ
jgi:NTE family protein